MIRLHAGSGSDNRGDERGRAAGSIGRRARSRRYDGIEGQTGAGLIAGDVGRRGSNHGNRKPGGGEGRVQPFGRGRSGDGLESEKVSDRIC